MKWRKTRWMRWFRRMDERWMGWFRRMDEMVQEDEMVHVTK